MEASMSKKKTATTKKVKIDPQLVALPSLTIEGYSAAHVEAAVYRLWKAGMIDAHSTKPKQIIPATLTMKGFRALQKREKVSV
jgi:hypothetical protein